MMLSTLRFSLSLLSDTTRDFALLLQINILRPNGLILHSFNLYHFMRTKHLRFSSVPLQIRKHWGGGIMGSKSQARVAKREKARQRELAQKGM